jgi:hypothetical protein
MEFGLAFVVMVAAFVVMVAAFVVDIVAFESWTDTFVEVVAFGVGFCVVVAVTELAAFVIAASGGLAFGLAVAVTEPVVIAVVGAVGACECEHCVVTVDLGIVVWLLWLLLVLVQTVIGFWLTWKRLRIEIEGS